MWEEDLVPCVGSSRTQKKKKKIQNEQERHKSSMMDTTRMTLHAIQALRSSLDKDTILLACDVLYERTGSDVNERKDDAARALVLNAGALDAVLYALNKAIREQDSVRVAPLQRLVRNLGRNVQASAELADKKTAQLALFALKSAWGMRSSAVAESACGVIWSQSINKENARKLANEHNAAGFVLDAMVLHANDPAVAKFGLGALVALMSSSASNAFLDHCGRVVLDIAKRYMEQRDISELACHAIKLLCAASTSMRDLICKYFGATNGPSLALVLNQALKLHGTLSKKLVKNIVFSLDRVLILRPGDVLRRAYEVGLKSSLRTVALFLAGQDDDEDEPLREEITWVMERLTQNIRFDLEQETEIVPRHVRSFQTNGNTVTAAELFESSWLLCGFSEGARVYNVRNGRLKRSTGNLETNVTSVAFDSRGVRALLGTARGKVLVWDFQDEFSVMQSHIHPNELIWFVGFGDENRVVYGAGQNMYLWDLRNNSVSRVVSAHRACCTGKGTFMSTHHEFDDESGEWIRSRMHVWTLDESKNALASVVSLDSGMAHPVHAIAIQGKDVVFSAGVHNNTITRWDANLGIQDEHFENSQVGDIESIIASSKTNRVLVSSSVGEAFIFDSLNGRVVARFDSLAPIYTSAFSGDGGYVLHCWADGDASLYDLCLADRERLLALCYMVKKRDGPKPLPVDVLRRVREFLF